MGPEEHSPAKGKKKQRGTLSAAPLERAWRVVRRNGLRSASIETRKAIEAFDLCATKNLRRLDVELRKGRFTFRPQIGHAVARPGKSSRPIVVAPVENRIVQRALLDHLVRQPAIKSLLTIPTSFGAVQGRGCREALRLLLEKIRGGAKFYIRSDIKGFFTSIPRSPIIEFIRGAGVEAWVADLTDAASSTTLANLEELGEDASLFPLGDTGVPQGSALSALMGNILLREFDSKLNDHGITCIRYIDDFLILGPTRESTRKAFNSGLRMLEQLGLEAYDPDKDKDKAESGPTNTKIEFLGQTITRELVFPSSASRGKLVEKIDEILRKGRRSIQRLSMGQSTLRRSPGVTQVLRDVDNLIRGWSNAYRFCDPRCAALIALEARIDDRVADFMSFVRKCRKRAPPGPRTIRKIFGVHVLDQTPYEPLLAPSD